MKDVQSGTLTTEQLNTYQCGSEPIVGDIVKGCVEANKGHTYYRFDPNKEYVVNNVRYGDSAVNHNRIYALISGFGGGIHPARFNLIRRANGQNANQNTSEPPNNDGRTTCFWCSSPTKKVPKFGSGFYDVCSKCGK